jgi:Na+/melibiose symporter-like transporter
MLFQFGWAAAQISHLALIPELSTDPSKRQSMNSYRYYLSVEHINLFRNAFNVIANLSIFTCLYLLLNFNNDEKTISPADLKYFRVGFLILYMHLRQKFKNLPHQHHDLLSRINA